MNWLAHIFLSEKHIDFKIGNYLADPLKGRVWQNASNELIKGMHVHKIIDSYTDTHEVFKLSKDRLRSYGLLRGIIIDITYDYLLSKNWEEYCLISQEEFTLDFNEKASKRLPQMPTKAQESLSSFIKRDVLNRYKSLSDLKIAFEKLDLRLSPRLKARDTASSYFNSVEKNIDKIEEDFLIFFPQLCKKVKDNTDTKLLTHWKI